ncbi:MAG: hypothetical protein FWE09_00450 [Treponema sp.]|nr:hypothetical protein [Treponema sp.]
MKATFFKDGRFYMSVEEESFADINGFLRRNGWTTKPAAEADFPLAVFDGSGEELEVRLDSRAQ